jgi:hypothetical protein
MACNIIYDNKGKIQTVLTPQGVESKLFKQIAKIPHVSSLENALEIYKNTYTKRFYSVIGEKISSYSESINNALSQAKNMEIEGKALSEIETETGWTKENNQWKYLDKEALKKFKITEGSLNLETEQNLKDVINNDSILQNISELDDVKVLFDEDLPLSVASYNPKTKLIRIGKSDASRLDAEPISGERNNILTSSLLHELQHVIQYLEGFPTGGNEFTVLSSARKELELPVNVAPFVFLNEANKYKGGNPIVKQATELLKNFLSKGQDRTVLFDSYKKLFGEVEARFVQDIFSKLKNGETLDGATYTELKSDFISKEGVEEQYVVFNEPNLSFKSDKGNEFSSFKEALLDSTGADIEISVGGVPLMVVSSNTNTSTLGGFINDAIKQGVLSEQRIVDQGESFLKAEGFSQARQIINEVVLKEDALSNLGAGSVKIHTDGRIELKDTSVVEIDGKVVNKNEIKEKTFPELSQEFSEETASELSIQNAVRDNYKKATNTEQVLSEETLKLKLLNILNQLGVNVTSISDYVQKYKIRNGVEPSAEALADIGNLVIAFRDGQIPVDALTEEASHFIVEAWNNEEIENLLRNIHKTESYAEFSESYREIYLRENPSATDAEIEQLVRREVLGKELAKAIQNNFSVEGKTDIQRSILQKIFDLFRQFFGAINVNEQFYNDLSILTNKVQELLLTQDVSSLNKSQLVNKKFRLYSIGKSGDVKIDSLRETAYKTVSVLLDQEKILAKAKKNSPANIQELNRLEADLMNKTEDALVKKEVADLLSLVKRQTAYLDRALTSASRKGETLSNEEGIVLYNLRQQTAPMLAKMRLIITESKDKDYKPFLSLIEKVEADVNLLQEKFKSTENDILDRVVDRLMQRHKIPATTTRKDGSVRDMRQELRNSLITAEKDTNMLYAWFGQATHAKDPILNMLGSVLGDIFTSAEQNHIRRAKTLQNELRKLGVKEDEASDFIKDKWILSLWDFEAFRNREKEIKQELLKEVSQTDKDLSDEDTFREVFKSLDSNKLSTYQIKLAERMRQEKENDFDDNYYSEREESLKGVSEETKIALRKLSVDRGELMSRVTTENGRPKYTLQDRHDLDALNIKRRGLKSIFELDGDLKQGLFENPNGEIEVEGKRYSLAQNASPEAKIAFDMQKLDAKFIAELKEKGELNDKGLSSVFEQELRDIQNSEEAKEFFLMNTNIGFSQNFWDSFEDSKSFKERAEEFVAENPEYEDKFEQYLELLTKRNNILKRFKNSRNASDTLADDMGTDFRKEILVLSNSIEEIASSLSSIKGFPEGSSLDVAESKPNQSYYGALTDYGYTTEEEKLKFAKENMTSNALRKVTEMESALDRLYKDKPLNKREQKIIEDFTGIELSEISKDEISSLKLQYAETKLAPYYKSFAPKGFSELMMELEQGNKSAVEVMEELKTNPNITLSNHYSYYEKTEVENRNPNRIQSFAGGFTQPRLYDSQGNEKYINKDFVEMFAPKKENGRIVFDENGNITPTKNQKKYEYYKLILEYRKDTLKSLNEYGYHNAFLAPQITSTFMEQVDTVLNKNNKGQAVKEWWKDITKFRADELETGQEIKGESLYRSAGIKVVPKYYLRELPEGDQISQDLFYMLTLDAQQAELYKSRVQGFSEISALQDSLIKRKNPEGKKAETTSTYKMFQSYMDGAVFGIRERRDARVTLPFLGEVNIIKVIDAMHKWLQNRSLAYNLIIPATSWLTAETTLLMERVVGQYVDNDSYRKASRELSKLGKDSIKEGFNLDSKSKISIIGEHFGIFDLDNKFKNSKYNKGVRFLGRSGYILHTAANFTPIGKSLLSGLYGNRLVGSEFVDFNQFKKLQQNSGKDSKTISAEWKALENKSLYNFIRIDEKTNTMTYDFTEIDKVMSREDFRNAELATTSKIKKLFELVDGQIRTEERTLLQRDAIGRFTMTHSSWLAVAISRRFKSRHYSLQTGQEEEGTYVTFGRVLTRALNGIKKGNMKEFINEFKNADEVEKQNLKRIMIEQGFLQSMFLLSLGLGAFADDDENKDLFIAQATAYLLERTVNETSSSQFGLTGELYGKVKEPIVGLTNIADVVKFWEAFNWWTPIERGAYKDIPVAGAYLLKNVPGFKQAWQFSSGENLKKTRDQYDFFNKQENFIMMNYIINEDNLKE